ncbi:hydroxyectoine utilization dehydratase EutB [Pseudotabrizicola alkalilacus]|uniref:Hydroxyectoine utilization dehydratase EutB n=1 Tax=Pseudotabrizicola alkalilacus TaxID=2305252 RepID=A0A411Z0B0_9RHOB|nr:hydroxyectoine utilization dehydratase EutB [Pseudotabrizicola alkalilacus]RGP36490.1 hydroxyectoine utilization dehydratase EutB [Pseudotabrizicola alkalilacus]
MTAPLAVTLDDIERAALRLRGHIRHTPMLADPLLAGCLLKLEYRQITGAFKLRGATNAVLSLSPDQLARGVVTASTGNHGRALAHAARAAGGRAVVCLSHLVPDNKVQAIRDLGAEVRIIGQSQDEAMAEVTRAVAQEGLTEVPPFDHPDVVAGQGTLGLEILADCPAPGVVLIPLSGGGLAAGVAAAIRALSPATRIIGVSMERGAAMAASLAAGHAVEVQELPTLADSLGGGIGLANRVTFAMCRALLDDVVLVNEDEIAAAMRHIHSVTGDAVEGAAAVGVAALLAGRVACAPATVCILSGANIAPETFAQIMKGQSA